MKKMFTAVMALSMLMTLMVGPASAGSVSKSGAVGANECATTYSRLSHASRSRFQIYGSTSSHNGRGWCTLKVGVTMVASSHKWGSYSGACTPTNWGDYYVRTNEVIHYDGYVTGGTYVKRSTTTRYDGVRTTRAGTQHAAWHEDDSWSTSCNILPFLSRNS